MPVVTGTSEQDAAGLLGDCYADIRRIARSLVSGSSAASFQPTELVHEAALRMLRIDMLKVHDQGHMLALAARIMRQALIDETRRAGAAKRQMPELMTVWPERQDVLVSLDQLEAAVTELTRISPQHAEIIELRFTLGMTIDETAAACGLSARTVKRRWQTARAWLQRYLERNE